MATEQWKREHLEEMRAYRRKHYHRNKKQYFDRVKRRAKELLKYVRALKESLSCQKCGEDDPRCLDFHHKNPKKKTIAISRAYRYGWSIQRLKKEIAKCVVLCANCHRKEHLSL